MKRILIPILSVAAAWLPLAAQAASDHDHSSHATAAPNASATEAPMVDGTVKKVDKVAGKVTLAHGPLTNLGMPAMTMAFRVKEAAWLAQLREGDKVRFAVDKLNGAFTVVRLEGAK